MVWRGVVGVVVMMLVGSTACGSDREKERDREPEAVKVELAPLTLEPPDPYEGARRRMVEDVIAHGITDPRTIDAMRRVPRHRFVPPDVRDQAYEDHAVSIGFGLTISQPYIVAMMTQAAKVDAGDKVLEIGTGSGYQAAVLRAMGAEVYTIEIIDSLLARTRKVFAKHGLDIHMRAGDGYYGWPEEAPFDAILVTAAVEAIPQPLLEQLGNGGRIVAPVGDDQSQELRVVTKTQGSYDEDVLSEVMFSPMIGEGVSSNEP